MAITVAELEKLVNILQEYAVTTDKTEAEDILRKNQDLILLAKDVDYSSKTQAENDKSKFKDKSHGLGRMLMFLLNYYGETYLADGFLTVYDDDPRSFGSSHANTYKLELKDPETHDKFGDYSPTAEDKPYDFNSQFIKQITTYPEGNRVDTTITAWDSFQKAYTTPVRTFDFKSAFWKSGHEHSVNYILRIDFKLNLHVINRITKEEKIFEFIPNPEHEEFLKKYSEMLSVMWQLGDYAWNNFIIK